jgi:endogenous inhibitor of DNA gyrase (YacG/DUF329 family)
MAGQAIKTRGREPRGITYITAKDREPYRVMEEALAYSVACPVCEKRVFDISELPARPIRVRLKCPHCRKLVQVPVRLDTT